MLEIVPVTAFYYLYMCNIHTYGDVWKGMAHPRSMYAHPVKSNSATPGEICLSDYVNVSCKCYFFVYGGCT